MPRPRSNSENTVESLVINTGPLIALFKAQALDIAGQLPYKLICPSQVRAELDAGAKQGYGDIRPAWLEELPLQKPLDLVALAALDAGEAAVVQLALEHGIRYVCIDERRGRRAASAAGLHVVGTLGLLLRAKSLGLIAAVRPFIDRLSRGGDWYDDALVARVLRAAGETGTVESR